MDLKRWAVFRSLDPVFASNVKWAQLIGICSYDFNGSETELVQPRAGMLIMKNGDVYFVARDEDDLELMGIKEVEHYMLKVPYKMNALCGQDIIEICSGYSRTLALTRDGRVFEWGEFEVLVNVDPFIDPDETNNQPMEPTLVSGGLKDRRVIQLACGTHHRLALTSEGEVYAWGNNEYGNLGTGSLRSEREPVKIAGINVKMSSIACGEYTSYAVSECGRVWSWGESSNGALGYESRREQLSPELVQMLFDIKKVAAGQRHVLALSSSGKVYFWGKDQRGVNVVRPELVNFGNEKVDDIGALQNCPLSVCKTQDGTVYFWGLLHGKHFLKPRKTDFSTMDEVFASSDVPLMLNPVRFDCLGQKYSEEIGLAFNDASTADFKFHNSDGEIIHAHKNFLKLRSEYFRGKFAHDWKDKDYGSNSEYSASGFRSFIHYLYTNRIEPPVQTVDYAIDLIKIGHYYNEDDLIKRAEQQLILMIDSDNALKIYDEVAYTFELQNVQKHVLKIVSPVINEVKTSSFYQDMRREARIHFRDQLDEEYDFVCVKRRRVE